MLLELVYGTGPVGTEEAGERTVGQDAATGLAPGAIVGLVVGVPDPLDRRAADRARLAEPAVHRHPLAERRHLAREVVAGLGAEPVGPLHEDRTGRVMEPSHVGVGQSSGLLERRKPGTMQDLVGVRVADAAEEPGIGQRAFEGVVLAPEPGLGPGGWTRAVCFPLR